MAIRITVKDELNKRYDVFYKTLNKNVMNIPRGRKLKECRIDVDIREIKDIKKVREFLDTLEVGMYEG